MRRLLPAATLVAMAFTTRISAQERATAKTGAAPDPTGVWRGTSLCLVRPSACNDEVVVYRVTTTPTKDSLMLDARKIVNGAEEEMAVLPCRFAATGGRLTCTMRNGTWNFVVSRDSLTGELRLPDNTRFRDVRTARSR